MTRFTLRRLTGGLALLLLCGAAGAQTLALEGVWESSADWQDPATVTVHVRRLRQKLEDDPSDPKHILTAYGVGYRFEP